MHTLRIPTSRDEISPALMADLIANLRKLCNLSGTGCTVTELPNGISIDVPPPKEKRRGKLLEKLYGCSYAKAATIHIYRNADGSDQEVVNEKDIFYVGDPLNKVANALIADDAGGNDELCLDVGTCFDSHFAKDSQRWELDDPGSCCEPSEEFSEEESSEEESSEEISSEEISSEEISSEIPSEEESSEEIPSEEIPSEEIPSEEVSSEELSSGGEISCEFPLTQDLPVCTGCPDYVIGVKNGCLCLIPVSKCPT